MYKLPTILEGWTLQSVMRLADNASIPFDPDNMDYVDYLKWVAEGNTPLPAEDTP